MMRLDTQSGGQQDVTDVAELRRILETLNADGNGFAILSSGEEFFLQTAIEDDGFIIEKREGSHLAHACAARSGAGPRDVPDARSRKADGGHDRFSFGEMVEIFSAYLSGAPMPETVQWLPMDMPDPGSLAAKFSNRSLLVSLFLILALLTAFLAWMRFGVFRM